MEKLFKLSKKELLIKCEELNLIKFKSKTKKELIELINNTIIDTSNTIIDTNNIIIDANNTIIDTNIKEYKLIDLFAGTGAFSLAFEDNIKTIYANDILESSEKIYNLNNNIKLIRKDLIDIKNNEIPDFNILTAGFPCQPFSIAGKQLGFDDIRSNVFWKILSIIKDKTPEIIILENVKNLQSHNEGKTFKIIIEKLEELNYYIKYSILNTSKISGIPHNRERIYIVCFKNIHFYNKFNFEFPKIQLEPISKYLEQDIDDKYYYSNKTKIYNDLITNVTKHISTNTIYQYRRYYIRENKNNVCPTLTANMGTGGHNIPILLDDKGIRKLTPRECFNLQGFPKTYKLPKIADNKLYSLAGNAVSLPVIKLIANKIINLLLYE